MTPFCMHLGALIFKRKFGFEAPEDFAAIIPERPFGVCTFKNGAFTVSENIWICKDWNCPDVFWVIFQKRCYWQHGRQVKRFLNRLKRECEFRRC